MITQSLCNELVLLTKDKKELHVFRTFESAIDHKKIDDNMIMHTDNHKQLQKEILPDTKLIIHKT